MFLEACGQTVLGHSDVYAKNSACSAPLWEPKFREVRLADDVLVSWADWGGKGGGSLLLSPNLIFPKPVSFKCALYSPLH